LNYTRKSADFTMVLLITQLQVSDESLVAMNHLSKALALNNQKQVEKCRLFLHFSSRFVS